MTPQRRTTGQSSEPSGNEQARTEYRVMCIPAATGEPAIWCRSLEEFLPRDFGQASKEKAEGYYLDVWVESRTVTPWHRDEPSPAEEVR